MNNHHKDKNQVEFHCMHQFSQRGEVWGGAGLGVGWGLGGKGMRDYIYIYIVESDCMQQRKLVRGVLLTWDLIVDGVLVLLGTEG